MLQRFAIGVFAVVLATSTATAGPRMDKCVKWAKRAGAAVCIAWATVHAPSTADAHKTLVQQQKEQRESQMKLDAVARNKRNMTQQPPNKKPPRAIRAERPRYKAPTRAPRDLPRNTSYKAKAETARNSQAGKRRR